MLVQAARSLPPATAGGRGGCIGRRARLAARGARVCWQAQSPGTSVRNGKRNDRHFFPPLEELRESPRGFARAALVVCRFLSARYTAAAVCIMLEEIVRSGQLRSDSRSVAATTDRRGAANGSPSLFQFTERKSHPLRLGRHVDGGCPRRERPNHAVGGGPTASESMCLRPACRAFERIGTCLHPPVDGKALPVDDAFPRGCRTQTPACSPSAGQGARQPERTRWRIGDSGRQKQQGGPVSQTPPSA